MIPLRKGYFLKCPSCGNERTKKQFIMSLEGTGQNEFKIKDKLYQLIKNAQTPLYPKILLSCFLLMIAFGLHQESRNSKMMAAAVQEYYIHPKANSLLIIRDAQESFPFRICFVKKIKKKKALIFGSQLTYKYERDARKELDKLRDIKSAKIFFKEFCAGEVVGLNDLTRQTISYLSSGPELEFAKIASM